MQKGNIDITTENIFPVIKKFLYSDHEIFLREIVSNAVDATQKLKTYSSKGDFKGEMGDLTIRIAVNKDAKTITISDRGIGMTAEEIDKYINQIAFSGANDFLEKYKNDANAIIGHFGLGFYSSFMVADKVEIITKSYREDAKAVKWSCDGSPAFEIDECDKAERGTDIVLHVSEDCKEFLENSKINELLQKYCRFLPVPVAFGKKTEWKDGKQVETEEDNIVNDTNPLWMQTPSTLKDEDYKSFYRKLYPMGDDPLFWIHLNVDFPFHLTGILYFPKIKNNIEIHRNKIQLYCNQVFVTDEVENIVPEFLTLLHGVIDSPDIPLNVSRSYLQSDSNVKKISTYITKKVCDRLLSIFKNDRKEYEEKWDNLKLFIHYGMLSEPDFYDKASKFSLLKDVEGKYFTYEEYRELIKENQTDKEGNLIYLYANNTEEQFSYIEAAKAKGYSVLLLDGQLDAPLVGLLEQKFEKSRFTRVDADVIDRLIAKENNAENALTPQETERLAMVFKAEMPHTEKTEFQVEVQSMGESALPVIITQSEYMRRMKEMSRIQPGMAFYGEMPDMYNFIVNADHPVVKAILADANAQLNNTLAPVEAELKGLEARHTALESAFKDKKEEEISADDREMLKQCNDSISEQKQKEKEIFSAYAKGNRTISQLLDIALLQNGQLKGAALDKFIKRSIDMIK
ncbi:MAG: molecular chaperone HtpG [Prevotellamassilia sp.]|jgi:molecular chaperone HtpG|uniref:molecular chaperone HtpG n=2 Tax=Alloprevotella sp. TaxID=1872471 RepID=UPI002EC5F61A|nr:molecular chaperone HtpG [Prevotellamassilia sp.]